MPEISRFYGIVIKIFYDDHNPPHFHAEYGSMRFSLASTPWPFSLAVSRLVLWDS